jgi:hypothetical protein
MSTVVLMNAATATNHIDHALAYFVAALRELSLPALRPLRPRDCFADVVREAAELHRLAVR